MSCKGSHLCLLQIGLWGSKGAKYLPPPPSPWAMFGTGAVWLHPPPLCETNTLVRAIVGIVPATLGTVFHFALCRSPPPVNNTRCYFRQICDFSVVLARGGVSFFFPGERCLWQCH